jgi:hypothetical protein
MLISKEVAVGLSNAEIYSEVQGDKENNRFKPKTIFTINGHQIQMCYSILSHLEFKAKITHLRNLTTAWIIKINEAVATAKYVLESENKTVH